MKSFILPAGSKTGNLLPCMVLGLAAKARAFDKALHYASLHECTREDVQAYLDSLVRRNKFPDWQIDQAHDALRILCEDFLLAFPGLGSGL